MQSRKGIVATLGVTQTLAWGSSYYLPAILAVPIGRDIGLSASWTYAGLSLGLGASAFLGPRLGRIIDQRGGKQVLCASNFVFVLGLTLLAGCAGAKTLLLAWLLLGVAMAAGLYEPAFATLTRFYGHDSRSAITGVTLIAGFASTVSWPFTAFLEHRFGWRETCLVWAALHVVVGLPLNAWALSRTLDAIPDELPRSEVEAEAHQKRADRNMLVFAVLFTAWGVVSIGMSTNLPRLLSAVGASPAAAIAAAALMGPAQVVARILEYSARNRINPLITAKLASALHPIAAIVIAIGGAPAIALFAIIHGAGAHRSGSGAFRNRSINRSIWSGDAVHLGGIVIAGLGCTIPTVGTGSDAESQVKSCACLPSGRVVCIVLRSPIYRLTCGATHKFC